LFLSTRALNVSSTRIFTSTFRQTAPKRLSAFVLLETGAAVMEAKVEIHICTKGRVCPKRSSLEVAQAIEVAAAKLHVEDRVEIHQEACMCLCRTGPTVFVKPGFHQYGNVAAADAEEIVSSHALHGIPVERLLINGKQRV
jgi:(2Fe-2S) ferredoxin